MPILLLLSPALAQEGFDAHGFHLAAFDADLRSPVVVPRAGAWSDGSVFAGALLEYAEAPLRWVPLDATGAPLDEVTVLDDLVTLDLSAGFTLADRVRVDLAAPVYLAATTLDGPLGAPVLGDVRSTATVALLRPEAGVGLALVGWLDEPTGPADQALGLSGLAGGAGMSSTVSPGAATFTGALGVASRPALDDHNLVGGGALTFGAAAGYLVSPRVGTTAELHGELPLGRPEEGAPIASSEVLLSARVRNERGAHLLAGGGFALGAGPGSAKVRLFVGGGFGPHGEPPPDDDPDDDGIVGSADACPTEAESRNGLRDDDGCPDEPARILVTVERQGSLVAGASIEASDGERRATGTSAARPWTVDTWTGTRWSISGRSGRCWSGEATVTPDPGDNPATLSLSPTHDSTVLVAVVDEGGAPLPEADLRWTGGPDACGPEGIRHPGAFPVGSGTWEITATAPGRRPAMARVEVAPGETRQVRAVLYPARVVIAPTQIITMDQVRFEHDSVSVSPRAMPILDELATTLLAHPELGRVEVAGHTDATGPDAYNLDLSQRRVEAVRAYLVARGVDEARLVAHGYGEMDPIDTNLTESGRSRNRRVEFVLLDQPAPP